MKPSFYAATLAARVRRLPADEGGNVLLLSSMMALLLTLFSALAVDSSQAVNHRVIAQNAADAAAETAALWQARALNVLQLLNNLHYQANAIIFAVEAGELATCAATPGTAAEENACCDDPWCWGACGGLIDEMAGECEVCSMAGPLNDFQGTVAHAILGVQSGVTDLFPALAFVFANQVSAAAGGDNLLTVVPQYAAAIARGLASSFGISLPDSFGSGSLGALQSVVSQLPEIHAFPLNPAAVLLNTRAVDGRNWPWKWNLFDIPEDLWKFGALALWETGKWTCRFDPWQFGTWWGSFDDHDSTGQWGWDDQYFRGHPGVMTWMAGKAEQPELAGLGSLRWFTGTPAAGEIQYQFLNQQNLPMFTDDYLNPDTGAALRVPPLIALASSQVEGTGVVAKDIDIFGGGVNFGAVQNIINVIDIRDSALPPVDSRPTLTQVYLPNYESGQAVFIYH